MLLKIFGFGSQSAPNELASQAQSAESPQAELEAIADAVAESEPTKPKRTLKRILLQWSIGTGVLGIAGAIGLPTFFNAVSCGGRIHEIQGRIYTSSMNRAQLAFHLENGRFAQTWEELDAGTEQVTETYRFRTEVEGDMAFNYAEVKALGNKPSRAERRRYERLFAVVGAATLLPDEAPMTGAESSPAVASTSTDESETQSEVAETQAIQTQVILCQADEPGVVLPPKPLLADGQLTCAPGTTVHSY